MTSEPHRLSACHRHPAVDVTGFCALCLHERLAGIPDHHPPPPLPRPRNTLSDLFSRNPNSHFRVFNDNDEANDETKTVKEFIDLELHRRNTNAATHSRTFWNGFFSTHKFKKWKWKHTSNNKTIDNHANGSAENPRGRRFRETQSEVGEYNLGRRSCDTDPRFSIDAGRVSFECPRASWDGCLIGKSCSRLSLNEDANSNQSNGHSNINNLESSGDARRSFGAFHRSNSRRRQSIAGLDDLKLMPNANVNSNGNAKVSPKVSPATFYGAKLLITEKELMDSYVRSSADAVQSDCVVESESNDVSDVPNEGKQKGLKKLQKWRSLWNKLGLVQKREDNVTTLEEGDSGVVANKPLEESLQRLKRVVNVEPVGQNLMRSYSVSCKSSCRMDGFGEDSETKGSVLNGRQEFMFQRNRSVRYSPNNPDTGLLRFYLTPSKSYKRSKAGRSSVKDWQSKLY